MLLDGLNSVWIKILPAATPNEFPVVNAIVPELAEDSNMLLEVVIRIDPDEAPTYVFTKILPELSNPSPD